MVEASGSFAYFSSHRPIHNAIPALSHDVGAMDDDLLEALGYFSEEVPTSVQVPSSPVVVDTATHSKLEEFPTDEVMHSMLLSLDIQELFSSDEQDKVAPMPQQSDKGPSSPVQQQEQDSSPKKIDRRLKPYSTAKRRNRKRPKHELEYLRTKVVELQEELEELSKTGVGSPSKDDQQLTLATTTGGSSWKQVAERQKYEVDSVMAENRKLRDRLLGQLQVARVLEAAIHEHQKKTGVSAICGVGRPLVMNMTDQQIFAQLNATAEVQIAEVNSVLTTSGLSNVFHELRGGFEFKRDSSSLSFRHEEARLLPFSMQASHNAIWSCLHNGSVGKHTQTQIVSNDHSNLIFHDTMELFKAHRVSLTKRAVFRRQIEADRVVFVWSSYVEIDGSVSVRLQEKGWSTCSTFEFYRGVTAGSGSSSNFVQGCFNRMAIQLTPELSTFKSDQEARLHIGEMTDLIVGTYRHNYGLIHEVVEKMLTTTQDDCSGKKVVLM